MAAPSNAYSNKNLCTYNNGITYNNLAILNTDIQTFKNRFYIDHVINTSDGIIGLCYINTYNWYHHNNNRLGTLNVHLNGGMRNYLDAGLHTKGHASIANIITYPVNRIKSNTTFWSSFYDASTLRGFSVAGENGVWYDYSSNDAIIPANSSTTVQEYAYTNLTYAQTVYIKPWIDNPEGRYYGDTVSFYGSDPVLGYMAQYRTSACSDNNNNILVWMSQADYARLDTVTENQSTTGIKVYYDDEYTQPVTGFLAQLKDSKVFYAYQGEIYSWVYCAPPVQQKDISIYATLEDNGFGAYYSVWISLNTGTKPYDIYISGTLGYFNNQDAQIFGEGSGYFNLVIPAGTNTATYQTDMPMNNGAAYVKAVNINIDPNSLTYDARKG